MCPMIHRHQGATNIFSSHDGCFFHPVKVVVVSVLLKRPLTLACLSAHLYTAYVW